MSMGAAARAFQIRPLPQENRQELRSALENEVERTRVRLNSGEQTAAKRAAYIKALLRLNTFLMEEKSLILSSFGPKRRV
jgi:hypothetical protein